MRSRRTAVKTLLAIALTTLGMGATLSLASTDSAFTGTTENASNTFGSAASYKPGTPVTTDSFGSAQASGWGSNFTVTATGSTSKVAGGVGSVTLGAGSTKPVSIKNASGSDIADQGVILRHRFVATAAQQLIRIGVRCLDTINVDTPSNCSWAQIETGKAINPDLTSVKGGNGGGQEGTQTANDTNWYNYRVEIVGYTLRAKRWADGASEPTAWEVTYTGSSSTMQTTGHMLLDFRNYSATANLEQQVDDVYYYSL